MSRIGKQPVPVPAGVEVKIDGQSVSIKGQNGQLELSVHPNISVAYDEESKSIVVTRGNNDRQNRALHGLSRSLISNMVTGVQNPFEKRLEIQGVGYQASLNGNDLSLQVGYSNTVVLPVPQGVTCELPDATHIIVKSADKQKCGQFAAEIRRVRPPEPYKGKGIRYQNEHVRRKVGKALASG